MYVDLFIYPFKNTVCFKTFGNKPTKLHKITRATKEKIKALIWDSYDQCLVTSSSLFVAIAIIRIFVV